MSTNAIKSSNRSRSEWAAYVERPFVIEHEIGKAPHQPALELVRQSAISPSMFDHVVATDECGAPILIADAPDHCENR